MDKKSALDQLKKYFGKYQVSFQFWGDGNNNVFIEKYGVYIYDSGGHKTPEDAMIAALEYLNKINKKP